jgi:molybdate transport system substrate-binding protein
MKILGTYLAGALLLLLFGATCSRAGEVTLSVAASLKDVMNDLTDRFARKNPGTVFRKNFGGSGVLAKQIEHGAPADIFISANREWPEYLQKKGLMSAAGTDTLAYNTLVVVGASGSAVASLQDLAKLSRIAIGSPKSVPAGEYAMEALRKAGLDRQLEKRLVMAKDVRECLMYAERGEVDAAFVYRTDALLARQAKILFAVPQELYPRVTYPMGLTTAGAGHAAARSFYAFLRGSEARAVLGTYGFALK